MTESHRSTDAQLEAGWALIREYISAVFCLFGAGAFVESEDGGVKLSPEAEEYIANYNAQQGTPDELQ